MVQRSAPFLVILSLALAAPVAANAGFAPTGKTRIGLVHETFDGSLGKERLVGRVVLMTRRTWKRTSHDGAVTAKFSEQADAGCSAVVHVSVRATISAQTAQERARRVTSPGHGVALLADAPRPGGWLRVQQLRGAPPASAPDIYGIAIVRVARHRYADVRAFAWFTGCTTAQIQAGPTAVGMRSALGSAQVLAHVTRR